MNIKEVSIIDAHKNECKFVMRRIGNTNRVEFFVSLNGKEFSLCKIGAMRTAMDTWSLVELLLKKPQKIESVSADVPVSKKSQKLKNGTPKISGQLWAKEQNSIEKKEPTSTTLESAHRPTKRVKK